MTMAPKATAATITAIPISLCVASSFQDHFPTVIVVGPRGRAWPPRPGDGGGGEGGDGDGGSGGDGDGGSAATRMSDATCEVV